MHVRLSTVLGTATAIVALVALALGLSALFRHNGHPVPGAPSGPYPADVDEALWAHVDAAWDTDLAHRTTAILQRQPWEDGEVILFTYEDNLPEAAGGGRQRVLSWVLVEPDPARSGWTVAASGNRERVHWPVDQAMPVPADVGVYSFWLSERQDSEGRTMSVIYGLRQRPGYPPDSVELTRGGQAIDVPLENDSFLYVTEGELTPERPEIRWLCDFPKGEWCGVGLFNDEPPARPEPLVFAGEIRNLNRTYDSLTGQFIPFTLGERDVTDPFAPGQLRLPTHVHFSLQWEVVATPSADWRVFVHLESDAGKLVLQSDATVDWPAQPCAGGQYSPECMASSRHEWEFPADFPPGVYTITVGLYDPDTGARAPVTSPPGATTPVKLGHVRVVPDEAASEAAQVMLGIFSGRPDPTWMLTPVQETRLRQQLSQLPPTDQRFDDTSWLPSGYHGFTLRLPPAQGQPASQFVRVYNGVVRLETEGQVIRLADEDHALERWLLDTAVGHAKKDVIETVRQDLETTPAPGVDVTPEGDASPRTSQPAPTASVPFTICQCSETWTRPSEAEQAAQVWDTPRRQNIPREML